MRDSPVIASLVGFLTLSAVFAVPTGTAKRNPPVADQVTVPGTIRHSLNQAKTKPGYEFVRQGPNSVMVASIKTHRAVGYYKCVCNVSASSSCEMVFSPNFVECKSGSCPGNGHCDLIGELPQLQNKQ